MKKALVLILILGSGCAVAPRLSNARTLPAGKIELVGGSHLSLVGSGQTRFPAGSLDSGVRIGASDGFELGAGLRGAWTPAIAVFGATGDVKVRIFEDQSFDLSIDPGVTYDAIFTGGEVGHFLSFDLTVLGGLNIEGGHQLILAPAFLDQWVLSRGAAPLQQPFFGGSIGFLWRADPTFSLLPSIGSFYSPVGTEGSGGTGVLQLSLGAFFEL